MCEDFNGPEHIPRMSLGDEKFVSIELRGLMELKKGLRMPPIKVVGLIINQDWS
jgi:hypothetical protein